MSATVRREVVVVQGFANEPRSDNQRRRVTSVSPAVSRLDAPRGAARRHGGRAGRLRGSVRAGAAPARPVRRPRAALRRAAGLFGVDTGTGRTVAFRAGERFAYRSTFRRWPRTRCCAGGPPANWRGRGPDRGGRPRPPVARVLRGNTTGVALIRAAAPAGWTVGDSYRSRGARGAARPCLEPRRARTPAIDEIP